MPSWWKIVCKHRRGSNSMRRPHKGKSRMRSTCARPTTEISQVVTTTGVVAPRYTDHIRSLKTRSSIFLLVPSNFGERNINYQQKKSRRPHTSTQRRETSRVCGRNKACLVNATHVYGCDRHPRMSRLSTCESHQPAQPRV